MMRPMRNKKTGMGQCGSSENAVAAAGHTSSPEPVPLLASKLHAKPLLRVSPEADGRMVLLGANEAAMEALGKDSTHNLDDISDRFEILHDSTTICQRLLELKRLPKPPSKMTWLGTGRFRTSSDGTWIVQHHAYILSKQVYLVLGDHTVMQLFQSQIDSGLSFRWDMTHKHTNESWTLTI